MGLGIGATWLVPLALAGASADLPAEPLQPLPVEIDLSIDQIQHQATVRQRVMIRITPLSRSSPPPVSVPVPTHRPRAEGEDMGQCIPLANVAGVKLGQGRNLLLILRNRRVISALLDRTCQVSSFYSGFYVERPADGMLCAGREALHARSGADCQFGSFRDVTPPRD
ncbi:hypothetical protein [Croceicoccus sp. BE223]|uniref:hypothetical protein n=1 Tax=Croceicoccus sp. BE223 TaxID=2817716 RepID=UPI0028600ADD|nr:hypothetical protein [Croceicoccus sp. BE223]MDR7103490.1 hypothetical protein [Croceicoccus sp. BE223]